MAKTKKKSSHSKSPAKAAPKTILKKAHTLKAAKGQSKKPIKTSKAGPTKTSKPTPVVKSPAHAFKATAQKSTKAAKAPEKLEKNKKDEKLKKTKSEEKISAPVKTDTVPTHLPKEGPEPRGAKDKASVKPDKTEKSRKSKDSDGPEHEEFDDELEEEVLSYGDAIRLTPEDLEDPEELILTDAEGRRYCKVKDCDQLAIVEGHCRYHYLALWKKIQTRKKILADGKLEKYIEELTSRYPDKYLEMIRRDLKTEKDFLSAIQELEIDDSAEAEFEEDSSFIDEVRGMSSARGPRADDSSGSDDY